MPRRKTETVGEIFRSFFKPRLKIVDGETYSTIPGVGKPINQKPGYKAPRKENSNFKPKNDQKSYGIGWGP